MKNTITIELDQSKTAALKMYLEQKESSLEAEISKFVEQLYNKIVPQNVRDFIDLSAKQTDKVKPKKTPQKPSVLP